MKTVVQLYIQGMVCGWRSMFHLYSSSSCVALQLWNKKLFNILFFCIFIIPSSVYDMATHFAWGNNYLENISMFRSLFFYYYYSFFLFLASFHIFLNIFIIFLCASLSSTYGFRFRIREWFFLFSFLFFGAKIAGKEDKSFDCRWWWYRDYKTMSVGG